MCGWGFKTTHKLRSNGHTFRLFWCSVVYACFVTFIGSIQEINISHGFCWFWEIIFSVLFLLLLIAGWHLALNACCSMCRRFLLKNQMHVEMAWLGLSFLLANVWSKWWKIPQHFAIDTVHELTTIKRLNGIGKKHPSDFVSTWSASALLCVGL